MKLRITFYSSITIVIFLFAIPSFAQEGVTSMGTDFWLGFMPFSIHGGGTALNIGSPTANIIHVDVYGGSTSGPVETHLNDTISANGVWTVESINTITWEDDSCEKAVYYGIHVYSLNPIVVYGFQQDIAGNPPTSEGYLGIPTPALGTEYYSSCYYDDRYTLGPPNPLAGEFLIVSPYDNNRITIGPVKTDTRVGINDTTIAHHKGDVWSITLMKGQTYLVQSTGTNYGEGDLTGTHIVSTKPVGLISGHQLCSIPIGELANDNGSKDEIMEMIPPTDEWGSEYFDMPTATRTVSGDLVRVIAADSNETVTATGNNNNSTATLLYPGDFYDFDHCVAPTVLQSNNGKKFLTVKMAYSQGYNGDPGQADPFSCVLPATRMFQKAMVFRTQPSIVAGGFNQYATFICAADSVTRIVINGLPIDAYVPAGRSVFSGTVPQMEAYRIQLPNGTVSYTARGPIPFGCYLEGLTMLQAYGDPASLALGINSTDTLPPQATIDSSSCGTFDVQLSDARVNDTHISDIALIRAKNDLRWSKPSYNYAFTLDSNFSAGANTASFLLNVIDLTQDAYAAVWTTDRAGNDTVYQYYYTAPKLSPTNDSTFDFGKVPINNDYTRSFGLTNKSNTTITISSIRVTGTDTSIFTSPSIPLSLRPGNVVNFAIGFSLSDTVPIFDTVIVTVDCAEFRYPLHVQGTTPIILAGDVDFGGVYLGDTVCQSVVIQNIGNAPLIIFPNYLLPDTVNFTFVDVNSLPDTIVPRGHLDLKLCFHPTSAGKIRTRLDWQTNITGIYAHQVKDTSTLVGIGDALGISYHPQSTSFEISVAPNPTSSAATISLSGASTANVEIFDVLGHEVASFRMAGSYEWNMDMLPSGTYIVRAEAGNSVVSKRVIKE